MPPAGATPQPASFAAGQQPQQRGTPPPRPTETAAAAAAPHGTAGAGLGVGAGQARSASAGVVSAPFPSAPPHPTMELDRPTPQRRALVEHRDLEYLEHIGQVLSNTSETDLEELVQQVQQTGVFQQMPPSAMPARAVTNPRRTLTGQNLAVRREGTGGSDGSLYPSGESPREQTRETTTSTPSMLRNPSKELISKVQELPGLYTPTFLAQLLSAVALHLPLSDVTSDAATWVESHRSSQTERATVALSELKARFSDGIDHIRSLGNIRKVEFWPAQFQFQGDVMGMAQGLSDWHTPKGYCWSKEVVQDLTSNCGVMTSRHLQSQPPEVVVPIYIYTSAMYRKVLWAFWIRVRDKWQECTRTWRDMEELYRDMLRKKDNTMRMKGEAAKAIAIGLKVVPDSLGKTVEMLPQRQYGLTGFLGSVAVGSDHRAEKLFIIRYENKPSSLSPLSNSVAWMCDPERYFYHDVYSVQRYMPPPGVFEYLESRPHDEERTDQKWQAYPWKNADADALIQKCYAEPNQSRYSDPLHMEVIHLIEALSLGGPVRRTIEAKLDNTDGKPTPQDIAHALELQTLTWKNKDFIIALSGSPRIITDTEPPHDPTSIFRVYHECKEQPYFLLNETMRNKQSHLASTPFYSSVEVSLAGKDSGRYVTKEQYSDEDCPDMVGKAVTFRHESASNKTLQWDQELEIWYMHRLKDVTGRVEHEDGKLRLGLWMLTVTRPLMWYLDNSLRGIPLESEPVKSYRGLANAVLPRDSYMQGGLVMWGAYSSSSVDQATATWFATQEKSAAVFTLRGKSCTLVAQWSRFAREKEYLYPPNTCFQVKTLLTEDQQQLLGREELQLYELDEVDDYESLTIYITQIINSAITGQGMELVDQLVSVIQSLVNKQLLKALKAVLTPNEPVLTQSYGIDVARRLRDLAEVDELPEDVARVLNEAMAQASRTGQDEAVKSIHELGADAGLCDQEGWTCVDHALIGGHRSTAELLLNLGEMGNPRDYIRRVDTSGSTLLHRMAELGLQKGVLLLLKLGADPLATDKNGNTPAFLAFGNGRKEIVHLLCPQEVLPEKLLQEMITYWSSSHYSCEENRERFSELKQSVVCAPYGADWEGNFYETLQQSRVDFDVIDGMKTWRTPVGTAWEEATVSDLVQDARLIWRMHFKEDQKDDFAIAMPLFVHTCSMYHRTFWATWVAQPEQVVGGKWRTLDNVNEDLEQALDACRAHPQGKSALGLSQFVQQELSMLLSASGRDEHIPPKLDCLFAPCSSNGSGLVGFGSAMTLPAPTTAAAAAPLEDGDSITSEARLLTSFPRLPEGSVQLIRFERSQDQIQGGLKASVAWIPTPDVAFNTSHTFSAESIDKMHGILEYIYSRDTRAVLKYDVPGKTRWEVAPIQCDQLTELADLCHAEPNPHKLNKSLHEKFMGLTSQDSLQDPTASLLSNYSNAQKVLLRAVLKAKIKADAHLTPEMMEQALALQWLTIEREVYLLALSGTPKVIARLDTTTNRPQVASLFRVCRPCDRHPGDYVNITSGNMGRKETHGARVEISAPRQVNGHYEILPSGGLGGEDYSRSPSNLTTRGQRRKQPQYPSARDRSLSLKSDPQRARDSDDTSSNFDGSVAGGAGGIPPATLTQRVATPARSHISTAMSSTADRFQECDGEEFRRLEAPHHIARFSDIKRKWIVFPVSGGVAKETLTEEYVSLHLGIYMKEYVWPLVSGIYHALCMLPAGQGNPNDSLYRASVTRSAGNVLQYDKDASVIWTSMTSCSKSRTLASSLVVGEESTIIKLCCRTARNIAAFSRFVREQEWMVPPNTVCRFVGPKEQEFGVHSLPLEEVDEGAAMVLSIRSLISSQLHAASSSRDDRKKVDALMKVTSYLEAQGGRRDGDALRHLVHGYNPDKPLLAEPKVFDIARKLLSNGASQKIVHDELGMCCYGGHKASVKCLLRLGADPDYKLSTGGTPLELAIFRGNLDIVKMLKPKEEDRHLSPDLMWEHAAQGRELAVWALHQLGFSLTDENEAGKTPAQLAHDNRKRFTVFLIRVLLCQQMHAKGVPIIPQRILEALPLDNVRDTIEDVVIAATRKGAVDACDAIIRSLGPELLQRLLEGNNNGRTCLHEAAVNADFCTGRGILVIKSLLSRLPELVDRADTSKSTPLTQAIISGRVEMVRVLIDNGANIISEDIDGMSPVHYAYKLDDDGGVNKEIKHIFNHQLKVRISDAGKRYITLRTDLQNQLMALANSMKERSSYARAHDGDAGSLDGSVAGSPQHAATPATYDKERREAELAAAAAADTEPGSEHPWVYQRPAEEFCISRAAVENVAWGGNDTRSELSIGIFMNWETSLSLRRFCYHFLAHGPPNETDDELEGRIKTWQNSNGSGHTLAQVIQEEQEARRKIERDVWTTHKTYKLQLDDFEYMLRVMKPKGVAESQWQRGVRYFVFHLVMALSVLYTAVLIPAGIAVSGNMWSIVDDSFEHVIISFDVICDVVFLLYFVMHARELQKEYKENARGGKELAPEDNDADERSFGRRFSSFSTAVFGSLAFWAAFVPVWPFQWVRLMMATSYGSSITEPLWRINKLLAIANLHKAKQYYCDQHDPNEFMITFVQLVGGMIYSMYFIACLLTVAGSLVPEGRNLSRNFLFVLRNMLLRETWDGPDGEDIYDSDAGLVFGKLVLKVLGAVYSAAYIAAFIRLCAVANLRRQMYIDKVDKVSDSLKEMHPVVRSIALDYYKRLWFTRGHVLLPQTSEVLSELSPSLGAVLLYQVTKTVKTEVSYFQHFDHRKLGQIVRNLRHMVCPKRSVVCTKGEEGRCMYFIVRGLFGVYKGGALDHKTGVWNAGTNDEIAKLGVGQFFGERSIIGGGLNTTRNANVVALEHSEVYILEKTTLQQVADTREYPDAVSELVRVCQERAHNSDIHHSDSFLDMLPDQRPPQGSAPPPNANGVVPERGMGRRRNARHVIEEDPEDTQNLLEDMSPPAYSNQSVRSLRRSTEGDASPSGPHDMHGLAGSHDSLHDTAARLHRDRLNATSNTVASTVTTNFSQTIAQVGGGTTHAPQAHRKDRGSVTQRRGVIGRKVTAVSLTNPLVGPQLGQQLDITSGENDSINSVQSEVTTESNTTDVTTQRRARMDVDA